MEHQAFELHPGIPAEGELIPWDPARLAQSHGRMVEVAASVGLPLGERKHWYNSIAAHEASEWAREQGAEEPFRKAVFHAYFVDDRNIGSPEVLAEIAEGLELDAADLRAALAEGRYHGRIQEQFEAARQVGVTGVPTYVAGGYAVVGAQPYAMFERLMEVLEQPPRAEPSS
ncbi:MAG: hypothetical protein QOF51_1095 [Chloroflexota bacterium]|nr:hypothetical protein [Chloroflexota bacterium]